MNYVCPHCKQTVSNKWYQSKVKLQCKSCNRFVFESVKKKLNQVSFVLTLLAIFSIIYFMDIMVADAWIKISLLVASLLLIFFIITILENKICSSVTSSK